MGNHARQKEQTTMTNAVDTIIPRHRATAKRISELLQIATDDGTLDELCAFLHPDAINAFCDAVSDMAGEAELRDDIETRA
ncbi:hypothetical protein [Bradyrhizobium sp. 150]|uniref:hypothetical protein n=1 Tax=Bradyrhizobium sp. 150 TaxID=2782625 RepID=UPI001FFBAFF6|nr:hypothetical protein [Bradyrhizobium sp. 150]MCK1671091.1 hypothetical protein [Bradyrhizobium sp. 150]